MNLKYGMRAASVVRHPSSLIKLRRACEVLLESWSWRRELNPRPAVYKTAALPTELRQRTHDYINRPRRRARNTHASSSAPRVEQVVYLRTECRCPLGPVATQSSHVAVVENTARPQGSAVGTGSARATGKQYCRQRTRPLVSGESQGPVCGAFKRLLQIARPSVIGRRVLE